jgi:hypothetical protein
MDYTGILSRAWKITWKFKILWIFGILSGCAQGGGNNRFNLQRNFGAGGQGPFAGGPLQQFLDQPQGQLLIVGLIALGVLIGLAIFVLSIIGRGGLIGGARLAIENDAVTFGEAWGFGLRVFWRLLGIGLLVALPILIVAVVGVAGTALTFGLGLICLVPLLCLTVIALIPLAIVAHFAQFYVVFDDERAIAAMRKGWELLKSKVGPILILGAILVVVGIVAGLILAAPLLALFAPAIVAMVASQGQQLGDLPAAALAAAGVGFVCYLPILLVLSGILQTWVMSAWALAFRHLTGREAAPPAAMVPPAPEAPAALA